MKLLPITAIALSLTALASVSSAATYNSNCGPQLESGISQTAFADQPTFSIKLKWNLTKGSHSSCVAYNASAVRQAKADARKVEAVADQKEADLIKQKLGICSDFDTTTAPQSIRKFCGDLLPLSSN